ncbi:hypothetical protein Tco_0626485 [Tanacetum coccineum]|uniref:Uncharacterized protein n=1 Tax=Tanacetum coccineum TaxID=301880 RepID=A0ABQ4WJZ6_9ASTR
MPLVLVVDRLSSSLKTHLVGVSSGSKSFFHMERGIKLMLALRSAKAKHSAISGKLHGMRNLPGSPSFSGNFFKITAEQFSFTGCKLQNIERNSSFDGRLFLDLLVVEPRRIRDIRFRLRSINGLRVVENSELAFPDNNLLQLHKHILGYYHDIMGKLAMRWHALLVSRFVPPQVTLLSSKPLLKKRKAEG